MWRPMCRNAEIRIEAMVSVLVVELRLERKRKEEVDDGRSRDQNSVVINSCPALAGAVHCNLDASVVGRKGSLLQATLH